MTHDTIGTMLVGLIAISLFIFALAFNTLLTVGITIAVALWVNRKAIAEWFNSYR